MAIFHNYHISNKQQYYYHSVIDKAMHAICSACHQYTRPGTVHQHSEFSGRHRNIEKPNKEGRSKSRRITAHPPHKKTVDLWKNQNQFIEPTHLLQTSVISNFLEPLNWHQLSCTPIFNFSTPFDTSINWSRLHILKTSLKVVKCLTAKGFVSTSTSWNSVGTPCNFKAQKIVHRT